jgi:hypothetical protein
MLTSEIELINLGIYINICGGRQCGNRYRENLPKLYSKSANLTRGNVVSSTLTAGLVTWSLHR